MSIQNEHNDTEPKDHKCDICGITISDCTGGVATCINKAVCDICGNEYGEVDANNHAELKHVEAKDATVDDEGNIEYWYCEDCGKYFGDKDGNNEISLADTIIAKLEKPADNPPTGENSIIFSLALTLISTMGIVCVENKRKRRG